MLVSTDASRLKVVLNNLISNAYKYHNANSDSPFISVKARSVDNTVRIEIADNGIGISEEHQKKIFDMFYRASENSEGSGLGLYIVKETLEKIGGTISVVSQENVGSTFTVILSKD